MVQLAEYFPSPLWDVVSSYLLANSPVDLPKDFLIMAENVARNMDIQVDQAYMPQWAFFSIDGQVILYQCHDGYYTAYFASGDDDVHGIVPIGDLPQLTREIIEKNEGGLLVVPSSTSIHTEQWTTPVVASCYRTLKLYSYKFADIMPFKGNELMSVTDGGLFYRHIADLWNNVHSKSERFPPYRKPTTMADIKRAMESEPKGDK